MQAFHNDPALKRATLDRIRAHLSAGDVVPLSGYWKESKGGPAYCAVDDPDPAVFERRLGIPRSLLPMVEAIFRDTYNMAPPDRKVPLEDSELALAHGFPADWLEAIAPGVDLTSVPAQMIVWILADRELGSIASATHEEVRAVLLEISAAHQAALDGRPPSGSQWTALRSRAMTLADGLPRNSVDAKVAATVESAAWPSTASGGITLDVFNTYIGELQAAANAQAGWTDADDELIARLTAELETAVKEVRKAFQGEARGREVDRILTEHFAYRRRHYPELVARENAARLAHNGLKWPRLLSCQRTLLGMLRRAAEHAPRD